jgi:hypothetical protein
LPVGLRWGSFAALLSLGLNAPKTGLAAFASLAGEQSRSSIIVLNCFCYLEAANQARTKAVNSLRDSLRVPKCRSAMTWKICSMLALLRLSDARSVATEALRTADFIMAVQVGDVFTPKA